MVSLKLHFFYRNFILFYGINATVIHFDKRNPVVYSLNAKSLAKIVLLFFCPSFSRINHSNNAIVKPPELTAQAAAKELESVMKRVREAQSTIAAAIEPGTHTPIAFV